MEQPSCLLFNVVEPSEVMVSRRTQSQAKGAANEAVKGSWGCFCLRRALTLQNRGMHQYVFPALLYLGSSEQCPISLHLATEGALLLMSRAPPPSYSTPASSWRLTFKGRDGDKASFFKKLEDIFKTINARCVADGDGQAVISLVIPRNRLALKPFIQRKMACTAADFGLGINKCAGQPEPAPGAQALDHDGGSHGGAPLSLQTKYCAMIAFGLQTSPSASYVLGRSLGEGSFGTVCLATSKCDGKMVALKYFRDSTYHAEINLEIAVCEMLMVAGPASEHIVQLIDVFRDSANTVLAMEYGGRTMEDAIESGLFRESTGLLAVDVTSQLAAGLHHIHANGVIHSGLSYKNILLDEENHVRYADFGSAFFEHLRPVSSPTQAVTGGLQVATLYFRAPEFLLGGPFGMPCDVWSIACVVYTLLMGHLPWQASSKGELLQQIFIALGSPAENGWSEAQGYPNYGRLCSGRCRQYIGEHVPFEFGDLMDCMLALNPSRRLNAMDFSAAAAQLRVVVRAEDTFHAATAKVVLRLRQASTRAGVVGSLGRPREGTWSPGNFQIAQDLPPMVFAPSGASRAP